MYNTFQSIHNRFNKIVNENGLFNIELRGVKIWVYSQFEIYNTLLKKMNVLDSPQSIPNKYKGIKAVPKIIKNCIFRNPMNGNYKKDILIFNHPRKICIDGEYVDIYTSYYIDIIKDKDYLVLERPYMYNHCNTHASNVKYLDILSIKSKIRILTRTVNLTKKEIDVIKNIEKILYKEFDCNINIMRIFINNIIKFKTRYDYYDKLLKKRSPRIIFIVVYYSYMELIHAAKKNHVPIIEIQHGAITPYSISYNFTYDKQRSTDYFPDKILLFGEYWKEGIEFPINHKDLIAIGFPFLEKQLNKFKNTKKNVHQILFVSQGTIGKQLYNIAKDLARMMPNYSILYKLHPGEYSTWKEKYAYDPYINNMEIIDYNKIELYSLLAESKVVIGVYSTAIYEAIFLNCYCILVDLPGIENMVNLIKYSSVKVVSGCEEIYNILGSNQETQFDINYFFKQNVYKKIFMKMLGE